MSILGPCLAACSDLQAGHDLLWGVNGHPLTSYPGISLEDQIALVADLGLASYRVDVTSTGQLDRLAALLTVAKAAGVGVLPILIPPVDLAKQTPQALRDTAHEFARICVSRFQNDIEVWELGNELENFAMLQPCEMQDDGKQYPCEWGPASGVGPLDYYGPRYEKVATVLRGLSEGTRSVSARARRAMGSAGWGHAGLFDRLAASGIEWDISVWHMYGGDYEWAFKKLAGFGKPIWVTEFNNSKGSAVDGERGQAEGLRAIMQDLRRLAPLYRIEAAFIYELLDEAYWKGDEACMGLVHLERDGTGKSWRLGDKKDGYGLVKAMVAAGRL